MPYTAQFFAEKLNLPVDYFNPFRNIEIDPALDLEELSKYAHSFGEVVGLGLAGFGALPGGTELDAQELDSAAGVRAEETLPDRLDFQPRAGGLPLYKAEARIYGVRQARHNELKTQLAKLTKADADLTAADKQRKAEWASAQGVTELAANHFYWINVLAEMRTAMIHAEASVARELKDKNGGQDIDTGVWLEMYEPVLPENSAYGGGKPERGGGGAVGRCGGFEAHQNAGQAARLPGGQAGTNDLLEKMVKQAADMAAAKAASNSISVIKITCRMIDRHKYSLSANEELAFAVQSNLQVSPSFTTNVLLGTNGVQPDPVDTNTYTFELTVGLKLPFKL